jgi:ankyrin repeat protein
MPRSSHDLHIACFFDAIRTLNERAVTTLIDLYQFDINDNSSYKDYYAVAIHIAAETNNESMIRLIVSLGAKVDSMDYYGETPLYKSLMYGRTESARVLLELGADLYSEVTRFDSEKNAEYIETPLSINKKRNDGVPYACVVPYTKEFKRREKLQKHAKTVGKIMGWYRQAVHNVWRPGGKGFREAELDFAHLICT